MSTLLEIATLAGALRFAVLEPEQHKGVIVENGLTDEAYVTLERGLSGDLPMYFMGHPVADAASRLEAIVSFLHERGLKPEVRVLSGPALPPLADQLTPGVLG